jgi:hypothetical protein
MAIAKVIGFAALACATVIAAARLVHVPWHAATWVPIMSVALLGVLVLQFVPSSGPALWLEAGAAAVLGLVFAARLAHSGVHLETAVDL